MEIDIAHQQAPGGVAVTVRVRLTGREASRLFLSGDTLIQLPLEDALPGSDSSPMPRASIFLSEIAGLRDGLTRVFTGSQAADTYAAIVRTQLETALEAM